MPSVRTRFNNQGTLQELVAGLQTSLLQTDSAL